MGWWLVYPAAIVWVSINSLVIVMQRRPAASTIAWLMVLTFLPFVGLGIYMIIGPLELRRRRRRRTISARIVDEGVRGLARLDDEAEHHQLAMVSIGLGGAPPLLAESVELYFDGTSAYAAIFDAIRGATDHVHAAYYIWDPDTIGTELRDLLVEKAKAGVRVRVLLDGTGSSDLGHSFLKPLRDAGASVAWFNPIRLRSLRGRRADFRMHRKIVVCDGATGFTGGMNVADVQSARFGPAYWRDTHMRLTGAAVWPLQRTFFEDWYFAAEELIAITVATVPPPAHQGTHLVQIVASGPDTLSASIQKVVFTAINQATRRLWLTTPYFVPDDPLLTALSTAALRGVDVRVLVPKKGDSRLVDMAARSYFPELLETNVRVYEYLPRFIHAKTIVCDDEVAVVGTANFDNRSFHLDFELIAVLFGAGANQRLAAQYELDLADAKELGRADLLAMPFVQRLGQASARLLSPLL
ncbi:MAG TPA: cardiolipin synthase [Kofleriaceae bacterium]|jgi:cardiolipin synthase